MQQKRKMKKDNKKNKIIIAQERMAIINSRTKKILQHLRKVVPIVRRKEINSGTIIRTMIAVFVKRKPV